MYINIYIYVYVYIHICKRVSGPGPRAVASAPPPGLSGAKTFPRAFRIALRFYHRFQSLKK